MAGKRKNHGRDWSDAQVLEIVREHERLVRSFLRSAGCPPDRVEDLAQETFLRLFTRPYEDRGVAGLRGYLCSIAKSLFLNSLRSDAARPDFESIERAWSVFQGDDAGESYVSALRECLQQLPGRTREALTMRYGANASRETIASDLQLSLGGVKSLLLRSKESLKACIQRKLGFAPSGTAEALR